MAQAAKKFRDRVEELIDRVEEPQRPLYDEARSISRKCLDKILRLRNVDQERSEAQNLRHWFEEQIPEGPCKGIDEGYETRDYEVRGLVFNPTSAVLDQVVKVRLVEMQNGSPAGERLISAIHFLSVRTTDGYWGPRFWRPGAQPDVAISRAVSA